MVSLGQVLSFIDLRFHDAQEELSFQESREENFVMRSGFMFLFGFIAFGLQAVVVLSPESYESDNPTQWSLADPRFLTGVAYSVEAMICMLMVILCFSRYHHRLRSSMWDAYILAGFPLSIAVYTFGNPFVTPALVGANAKASFEYNSLESELLLMMTLMAKTLAFSIYVPMMIHHLWPTLVLMTLIVACVTSSLGDGFIYMRMWKLCLFFASVAFSMLGARTKEQNLRTRWISAQEAQERQLLADCATTQLVETKALASGLEVVAHQFCEVVAMLDAEAKLCSNERIDAYFGKEVNGTLFTDFLSEEDAARFQVLVDRAGQSGLPQCAQVTLQRRFGNSEAQILLVCMGNKQNRHLIGLSSIMEELAPAQTLVEDPQKSPQIQLERGNRLPSHGGASQARSRIETGRETSLAFSLSIDVAESRPEKSIQTTTSWGDAGFTCLNCALPPRPPMSPACRDQEAMQNIRAKRDQVRIQRQASKESCEEQKEKGDDTRLSVRRPAVAANYDGIWVCTMVNLNMPQYHRALMIRDGDVVDGSGFRSFLELKGRKVVLQSAELQFMPGGELVMVGKGGRSLCYRLMPQEMLKELCFAQGWFQDAESSPSTDLFMQALSEWLVHGKAAEQRSNTPEPSELGKRYEHERSSTDSSAQFDGVWMLMNPPSMAPTWMLKFKILGNSVIDGDGDLLFLEDENGCVKLNSGVVEMDGDFLVRVGRRGKHWYYERKA